MAEPSRSSPHGDGRPRVVIVGAGFGGLWAARELAGKPVDVVLLDRNNYHAFLPLLYQVAAAEIEATQIAYPVRSIFRRTRNVRFLLGEARGVDTARRVVSTDAGEVPYDHLILALGSDSHFFDVPGAREHAFPLKTMGEAIRLRTRILTRFERAAHETDEERRRRLLTLVIVGGGPTGVEFAGALAELIHRPLKRDYPSIDFDEVRLLLVEATDALLRGYPERLGAYAVKRLGRMGVEVLPNAVVSRITPTSLFLEDGREIPSETVVWTAGVQGDSRAREWGLPTGPGGRVVVEETLQVRGQPGIYVVGDLAHLEQDGAPLPMVAPVATRQGERAAKNVLRRTEGKEPLPFRYRDPGMLATIGRNAGAAHVWGVAFTGFPAWLLWLGVHIVKLIGFRNRLFVLLNWAWDYFFFERAVRLILGPGREE